jgi:hypothetical protein
VSKLYSDDLIQGENYDKDHLKNVIINNGIWVYGYDAETIM